MRKIVTYIIVLLAVLTALSESLTAQRVRYIELNSIHALTVPENPYYTFDWTITYDIDGTVEVSSDSSVTHNILWDRRTTYHVQVVPILDSVGCYGEPVFLDVIPVDYLSLHAFDDFYSTVVNVPIAADVSVNDIEETGASIFYNPLLVVEPQHGTIDWFPDGTFLYTPDLDYVGPDYFVYEAFVNPNSQNEMRANATAYIQVRDDDTQSDIYVEKTGPAKALYGSTINYLIKILNKGPNVVENLSIRDNITFGLLNPRFVVDGLFDEFIAWDDSFKIEQLPANDSVLMYFKATVSDFAPQFVYNQAMAWSDVYDPVYEDNSSIWKTEITSIYADLPDMIFVSSCETKVLPGSESESSHEIIRYEWKMVDGSEAIGLDDPNIADPVFTPDTSTYGKNIDFILTVTDNENNIATDTLTVAVAVEPVAIIQPDTLYKDNDVDIVVNAKTSSGHGISYWWSSSDGEYTGQRNLDSLVITQTGTYSVTVTDQFGCESTDSVIVLRQSHPPVAQNDTVAIIAGTSTVLPNQGRDYLALSNDPDMQMQYLQSLPDSNVNVLNNDYDINDFDLYVKGLATLPEHSQYSFDSLGTFVITPDTGFWGTDYIEYIVCNTGIPSKCANAQIVIISLREPLNADVEIEKTGPQIAFWGDTIHYELKVWNNGPDTATSVLITDLFSNDLFNPEYSLDSGQVWEQWFDNYTYQQALLPNSDTLNIMLRAFVREDAQRSIPNKAWIETNIIEKDFENDTSEIVSRIKEMVIADAGPDSTIGACIDELVLDGSNSIGENLVYLWSPASNLSNRNVASPVFNNPGVGGEYTYTLTITDDDNITSEDQVTITVHQPPRAIINQPRYQMLLGDTIAISGTKSTGAAPLTYHWKTDNGFILPGDENKASARINTIGIYKLIVSDVAGCLDSTEVEVIEFFYDPFAIPDFYSTTRNGQITTENVMDNDYEPNGFPMSVTARTNVNTELGGKVTIRDDGSFDYTPPTNQSGKVDKFTYTLSSTQLDENGDEVIGDDGRAIRRTCEGYVLVTINHANDIARLNITKTPTVPGTVIDLPGGVKFRLEIENEGPATAVDAIVTDYLNPEHVRNVQYSINGGAFTPMTYDHSILRGFGLINLGDIADGDIVTIDIEATANRTIPPMMFNAGSVASTTYDDQWDWEDVLTRNVDTASIRVESNLYADIQLVELFDDRKNDRTIGACDNVSYVTAINSTPFDEIDQFEWSPREMFVTPDSFKTTFNHQYSDTTITISLSVLMGSDIKTAEMTIIFSEELIVDAGPDRKVNPNETLVIDATNSRGREAEFTWEKISGNDFERYENGNILTPVVGGTGVYVLHGIDYHGCMAADTVKVRENDLIPVNDIVNTLMDFAFNGNVGTNDYDPDGDSVIFTGQVRPPSHGTLSDIEGQPAGIKIGPDGAFTYIPGNAYKGPDFFEYQICDSNDPQMCKWGKVYINVFDVESPNNTPPVVNHDHIFVVPGVFFETNVLGNDLDIDGDRVHIQRIMENPQNALFDYQDDGTIMYPSESDASGFDELVYRVRDSQEPAVWNDGTMFFQIHRIASDNHRPVASDDVYLAVEKPISGNVRINDYDPDGDQFALNIDPIVQPEHGTIRFSSNGSFVYTPEEGYEGTDRIVYEVTETRTAQRYSDYATLYIVVIDESRYSTDVAIEKHAPDDLISGQTVLYELEITVEGPALANDIVIHDSLHAGLLDPQYSFDGITWREWRDGSLIIEQMFVSTDTVLYLRATVPDIFLDNPLRNSAYITHDMTELDFENDTSEVFTEIIQRVIADAGPDRTIGACYLDTFKLESVSLGSTGMEYQWFPADSVTSTTSRTTGIIMQPGETQEFMLIATHPVYGDVDTAYVNITVADPVIANGGNDVYPQDAQPVTLLANMSSGVGPLEYEWWVYDEDDEKVVLTNEEVLVVERTGTYYLTVTDIYGCTDTDPVYVGYKIEPFEAVDDYVETYQQTPVDIYVLRNDTIDVNDSYDLDLLLVLDMPKHGQVIPSTQDSFFTYIPDPYYVGMDSFTYLVTTAQSPPMQATVVIRVIELPPGVPEGFSPNGDGINDEFLIENIELYEDNELIIFSRWGNIVYKKEGYTNSEPWNGVANTGVRIGRGPVPTGVYLYILDLGPHELLKDKRYIKRTIYVASD